MLTYPIHLTTNYVKSLVCFLIDLNSYLIFCYLALCAFAYYLKYNICLKKEHVLHVFEFPAAQSSTNIGEILKKLLLIWKC